MKKDVVEFTRSFSECIGAGIPAGKALSLIQKSARLPLRVRNAAQEAEAALLLGSSVSFALSCATAVRFPEWYASFIALSDENGNLSPILSYLSKMLDDEQKARDRFWSSLLYPLCVAFLAFISSVLLVNVLGGSFFSGERLALYRAAAWKSIGTSGSFLAAVVVVVAAVFFKIMGREPLAALLNAISFLVGCGVPLVQAIDSAGSAVCRQKRLARTFGRICAGIRSGGAVCDVFSVCLSEAHFSAAARIVSAHLELCQATGTACALADAAAVLEARREKVRTAAAALAQPILMCAVAVYFVLLLKDTVMPLVLGGMDAL